jgi:hypothetical protein
MSELSSSSQARFESRRPTTIIVKRLRPSLPPIDPPFLCLGDVEEPLAPMPIVSSRQSGKSTENRRRRLAVSMPNLKVGMVFIPTPCDKKQLKISTDSFPSISRSIDLRSIFSHHNNLHLTTYITMIMNGELKNLASSIINDMFKSNLTVIDKMSSIDVVHFTHSKLKEVYHMPSHNVLGMCNNTPHSFVDLINQISKCNPVWILEVLANLTSKTTGLSHTMSQTDYNINLDEYTTMCMYLNQLWKHDSPPSRVVSSALYETAMV